jgi:UDP-GlcNAc:undecaprenyl-phosphate/decaprenyl-phosphate GlcNAc-1-phosphate transferase
VLTVIAVFISCAFLALLFTWTMRELALAHRWVAPPRSARHLHSKPIPRLGGVAIFAAFVVSIAAVWMTLKLLGIPPAFSSSRLLWILGPACIIFALGLCDDIHPLSPWIKFAVEIGAGLLLCAGGFSVVQIGSVFGQHQLGSVTGVLVTVFWVVWITNAFNLIDGVDGLAAGSALFATLVVFVNALISGDMLMSFMTAALAGCVLGFLRYNFNPATIFLGDSGSLFIGFTLSALALTEARKSPTLIAVSIPVVALGLPIMDTVLSVARRFLSGKPLFSADREHIHHKLLEKGLSQKQVVLLLYAVSGLFGVMSMFMRYPSSRVFAVVLVIVGASVFVGVQHLGYMEFFELRRVAQRTLEQREIIINNLAIRRAKSDLSRAGSLDTICEALRRAFQDNDFEGFEFTIAVQALRAAPGPMSVEIDGLYYDWSKNSLQTKGPRWQIALDLVSTRGLPVGALIVYRAYSSRSLRLDINLLTTDFGTAVADAVERSIAFAKLQREMATELFALTPAEILPSQG